MGGLEDRATLLEGTASAVRACVRCRLHVGRTFAVPGEGPPDAPIVLIGEAPGRQEDRTGRPFVGAAGQVLDRSLAASGLSRAEVYITNVVKCRPPANRPPKADEMQVCRPYLLAELDAVQPRLLVTLGAHALRGLVGTRPRFADARGTLIDFEGIRLLPTYHPAAVLYNRRLESVLAGDLRKVAALVREDEARMPRGGRLNARSRGPSRGATRSGRRAR